MDAQSPYSCGFRGSRPFHSARLSEAGFRRLLPVCCPGRAPSPRGPALARRGIEGDAHRGVDDSKGRKLYGDQRSPDGGTRVDRIEPPFAGDALQLGRTALAKLEARSRNQILDRARDEHLAGLRRLRHTGTDVDGDSAYLAVHQLALAGVEARAYLQAELCYRLRDGAGAADRPSRAVEAGEEAVTGGVKLLTVVADELPTDDSVVPLEELAPGPVAERYRLLGRADDVGEKDGGKDAVSFDDVPFVPVPDAAQKPLDLVRDLLRLDEVGVIVAR